MSIYDGLLKCPECGGENLHHESLEYFVREEDDKKGFHVFANENRDLRVDEKLNGNNSTRRGSIKIMFSCENCSIKSEYTIIQHKGCSYVGWMLEA